MNVLTPKKMILALCVLGLIALWIAAIALLGGQDRAESPETGQHGENHAHEAENVGHGDHDPGQPTGPDLRQEYYWNIDDPGLVAGGSENVFVGSVLSQTGEKPQTSSDPNDPGIPHMQFEVVVGTVIKSTGSGAVEEGQNLTVDALGGIDDDTGRPIPITVYYQEGTGAGTEAPETVQSLEEEKVAQDTTIKTGETYLFATNYNYTEKFHTVYAHPTGKQLLDSEAVEDATVAVYRRATESGANPEAAPGGGES